MRSMIPLCILFFTTFVGSTSAQYPVNFQDANLKVAVEDALGIWDPIPADMLALIELNASSLGIMDLTGLEYATNLQALDLRYNQISDIGALSGLDHLQTLILNDNRISDFSPLSGLGELRILNIHYNPISDLTALAGLSTLEDLTIRIMQISDISPLSIPYQSANSGSL